jgi:Lrp/AsnC family transcriptional regulator for asnA, asnC and gidA
MKESRGKEGPKIDALDLLMIGELERDGRLTISELSDRIGTSMATARRKLRRLVDEGIIDIVAVTNPMYLGFRTVATIGINVVPGQVESVAERLASLPNAHFVSVCIGRCDLTLWALFREPEDLANFLKDELSKVPGITRIETTMHMDIKKRTFRYLDPSMVGAGSMAPDFDRWMGQPSAQQRVVDTR